MPKRLMVKTIESVGAVDAGDDPEAVLTFWKRLTSKRTPSRGNEKESVSMGEEFDLAALPISDEQAEALDAYIAEQVAKATPIPEPEPVEDVEKGWPEEATELVEELRKQADETAAELAAEISKREHAEWVAKAEPFTELIGDATETGPVLRALAGSHPDEVETLLGWFKALADKVELAELFKRAGSPTEATVEDRREAFVKEKTAEGMTATEARAEFWRQNPDAVEASREGQ